MNNFINIKSQKRRGNGTSGPPRRGPKEPKRQRHPKRPGCQGAKHGGTTGGGRATQGTQRPNIVSSSLITYHFDLVPIKRGTNLRVVGVLGDSRDYGHIPEGDEYLVGFWGLQVEGELLVLNLESQVVGSKVPREGVVCFKGSEGIKVDLVLKIVPLVGH